MKSLLTALLMSVLPVVLVPGEPEPLSRAAILAFDLKNVLEADGVDPELNAEANLTFKAGGNTYTLEVVDDSGELCFARLSRFHKYTSEVTHDAVDLFNREVNYKTVKVLPTKSGYYLRTELLLADSKYFKAVYPRLIEFMDNAHQALRSKCPALKAILAKADSIAKAKSAARIDSLARARAAHADATNANGLNVDLKLLVEQTGNALVIYPVATLGTPADRQAVYPIGLRLYRNNALLQDADSPPDFSAIDTLSGTNPSTAHILKSWVDTQPEQANYRCELWLGTHCIAHTSYHNK